MSGNASSLSLTVKWPTKGSNWPQGIEAANIRLQSWDAMTNCQKSSNVAHCPYNALDFWAL
jgi:hypothetical protein